MKRTSLLLVVLLLTAWTLPAAAQDLAKTAGNQAKVLLDNDQVRVIELTVPPGGHTGMHSHGNSLVYFLSPGEAKQVKPDGSSQVMHSEPGKAVWVGPVTHDTFNVGKQPTRTLVVELKAPPSK